MEVFLHLFWGQIEVLDSMGGKESFYCHILNNATYIEREQGLFRPLKVQDGCIVLLR